MHVHTRSSPDADASATDLCRLAACSGVGRIGFVAHLDFHPEDYCYGGFCEKNYIAELDLAEAEGGTEVLRGLEIGEPHRYLDDAMTVFTPSRYDFITGALHWLGDRMILNEAPFAGNDPVPVVQRYYEETLEILDRGGISILAHMGIFRRGMARAGLPADLDETRLFPGLMKEVLEKAIRSEIAIEVNTAGLRRPENTTYPTPSVLSLYREMGGRLVTLGSDTHSLENAFYGLARGERVLRECGFDEYGFYRDGEYHSRPLQYIAD